MTITVKKAGEVAVKAAASVASSTASKPTTALSAANVSQVVNRSVTAAEAPFVTPARESTKVSLMPWKGWFSRWLTDVLGEERFKYLKNIVTFAPDDIYDGQPIMAHREIPVSATDPKIKFAYRWPSPGSQGPVKQPTMDDDEDPFDSGYYKRDTRRRYDSVEYGNPQVERMKLMMMDQNDPAVKEELERLERGPESSPGNGGVFATGPTDFDPTGLRASMSANWKAYNESLDKHMPNHLPTPVWHGKEEEYAKHYVDRGIPVPFGGFYEPLVHPTERRIATW